MYDHFSNNHLYSNSAQQTKVIKFKNRSGPQIAFTCIHEGRKKEKINIKIIDWIFSIKLLSLESAKKEEFNFMFACISSQTEMKEKGKERKTLSIT